MRILSFGSCNIDHVYKMPHFVRPGETLSSDGYSRFPGGKGLNQAVALGRAGLPVYFAGAIGSDGEFLRQTLKDAQVDTSALKTVDTPTGHAVIQVDEGGENCIILFPGANHKLAHTDIDNTLSRFCDGDILLLQNEINDIGYIIDRAYDRGMKIILNPAPFGENIRSLDLSKLHTLILNETEAEGLCGERKPDKIREFFLENHRDLEVVLTLGSDGCEYFGPRRCVSAPAFSVNAVDTTAAGDTFIGYYIYGMKNRLDTRASLTLASAASAITVSRLGASSSIPTIDEVKDFLAQIQIKNDFLASECGDRGSDSFNEFFFGD